MLSHPVRLSENVIVGPQATPEQLIKLKKIGVNTVINLCRDGELDQEITPDEERKLCRKLKINYMHFPLSLSTLKYQHIDEFRKKIRRRNAPFYIHCLLGQRSVPIGLILYAINKELGSKQVFAKADELGVTWNAPLVGSLVMTYLERESRLLV